MDVEKIAAKERGSRHCKKELTESLRLSNYILSLNFVSVGKKLPEIRGKHSKLIASS